MEQHSLLHSSTTTSSSPFASSCLARHSIADWILTIVIWVVGMHLDHAPPFERDIRPQLHDPDISYPHTTGPQQQIPAWLLWRLAVPLPLLLLVPLALFPPRNVPSLRLLAELWLGLLTSVGGALFLVCLVKNRVGRLRPDFLARCLPDANGVCTGDAKTILEGRKSFPSGHSALSFSGLFYVSLCAYMRLAPIPTPRLGRVWKVVLPALPWLVATHVALSRIQDYWHHWQDILVGTLLGHICAFASYRLRFGASGGLVPTSVSAEEEQSLLKVRSPPAEPV